MSIAEREETMGSMRRFESLDGDLAQPLDNERTNWPLKSLKLWKTSGKEQINGII